MTRRAILAIAAVAASACAPLRLEPTNAGFGNAFQALFEGFKRAARCGATLQLVDGANRKEKSRYRRICDRLTCAGASFVPAKSHPGEALSVSFKNALLPVGCPAGCAKRRMPRETRILRPAFEAANGGRWLAPLTCVGPNAAKRAAAGATRPFTTAAHIRSVRYDFERPPKRLKKERRRAGSNISLDASAPSYSAAEWEWLATAIDRRGDVFIASDNAPARDELVRRIAAHNRTACYVGRDQLGHSSYHHSSADDDHAMTVRTRRLPDGVERT